MTGEGSIAEVLAGEARWNVTCADCLDVLPTLADKSVDAVVTDPPYGVNLGATDPRGGAHGLALAGYGCCDSYERFVSAVVPRINAALDTAKRALVWTGPHIHEQRKPDAIGGVYLPAGAGRHCWGWKQFLPVLLYGTAPSLNLGARTPTAITDSSTPEPASKAHPVPKPVPWMLWSVRLASEPDHTILDPFAGSGTTGVAALRLGRRVILIEREPKWADLCRERLRAEEQSSTLQARRAGQVAMFGGAK